MALTMFGDADASEELRRQARDLKQVALKPAAAFCDGVAAMAEGHVAPLYDTLARHRWLDPLRDRVEFRQILHATRARHEHAVATFHEGGGLA
jgi:hypothetical protein